MPPSRSERAAFASALLVLAGCPGPRSPGSSGTPACPTDRTVVISSQEDVERFAACTTASSLTIRTGATITLAPLRELVSITGDLSVGPTVGMEELALAELREVGGTIHVMSNGSMRGVFLPRLERAGRIAIEANVSITTVAMPRLTTVSGSCMISENSLLELVDLSGLTEVGKDLVLTSNPNLTLIEAGKLERVQEVRVEGNRTLPAEQVEGIRAKTPPT